MEPYSTYKPWHNKQTGKTYLIPDEGKCLHYYFYSWTRNGTVPLACADVAAVSATDLLQWPQLAGQLSKLGIVPDGGQRFHAHCGLAAGATHRQPL